MDEHGVSNSSIRDEANTHLSAVSHAEQILPVDPALQDIHPSSPLQHHHAHQPTAPGEHVNQFAHLTDPALLIDRALLDPALGGTGDSDFPIDPALSGSTQPDPIPHMSPPAGFPLNHTQGYALQVQPQASHQPPPVDMAMEAPGPGVDELHPATSSASNSKRGGALPEDSDQELKRLAQENEHVPLKELATRVREDENGPRAERARQILGMRWLIASCDRAADTTVAVPRNRVYARYVSMCANERIKPLNPASFGKLVRLMFPEIKTRRLGVRGQSKYHYCGIKLKGDNMSSPMSRPTHQGSVSGSEPPPQTAEEDQLHVLTPPLLSSP